MEEGGMEEWEKGKSSGDPGWIALFLYLPF
jgi:hypothetical protein